MKNLKLHSSKKLQYYKMKISSFQTCQCTTYSLRWLGETKWIFIGSRGRCQFVRAIGKGNRLDRSCLYLRNNHIYLKHNLKRSKMSILMVTESIQAFSERTYSYFSILQYLSTGQKKRLCLFHMFLPYFHTLKAYPSPVLGAL